MTTKAFDCVDDKHRAAEKLLTHLGGMTKAEQLAFWQNRTEVLRELQARLRDESSLRPSGDEAV